MKYSNLELGTIEAVLNKLGGEEGVKRFLRGELVVSNPTLEWREQDGVIYVSVTSDGTTGEGWIDRLERKGFQVSDGIKNILRSWNFEPTKGITYPIVILKSVLFNFQERSTKEICAESARRRFKMPYIKNIEVACLIREAVTVEQVEAMKLPWITCFMQVEPIRDSDGDLICVCVYKDRNKDHYRLRLDRHPSKLDDTWDDEGGFAFIAT